MRLRVSIFLLFVLFTGLSLMGCGIEEELFPEVRDETAAFQVLSRDVEITTVEGKNNVAITLKLQFKAGVTEIVLSKFRLTVNEREVPINVYGVEEEGVPLLLTKNICQTEEVLTIVIKNSKPFPAPGGEFKRMLDYDRVCIESGDNIKAENIK